MTSVAIRPFDFVCRGVNLRITGNRQDLIEWAADIARHALLGDIEPHTSSVASFTSVFDLSEASDGQIVLTQDGNPEGVNTDREAFRKHLNSLVRVAIAENVADRMFMHAGAVAYKGKGIIFPGDSFVGKSTLVGELLKNGFDYMSDDYAIFDQDGGLYEFPRTLTIRTDGNGYVPVEVTAEELGASVASGPIPVRAVCLTTYEAGSKWEPVTLSPGQGVLEMVPFTFSFINRPEFSLSILNKVAERAIIVSSKRGSADTFVKTFRNFIDKLDG